MASFPLLRFVTRGSNSEHVAATGLFVLRAFGVVMMRPFSAAEFSFLPDFKGLKTSTLFGV